MAKVNIVVGDRMYFGIHDFNFAQI